MSTLISFHYFPPNHPLLFRSSTLYSPLSPFNSLPTCSLLRPFPLPDSPLIPPFFTHICHSYFLFISPSPTLISPPSYFSTLMTPLIPLYFHPLISPLFLIPPLFPRPYFPRISYSTLIPPFFPAYSPLIAPLFPLIPPLLPPYFTFITP